MLKKIFFSFILIVVLLLGYGYWQYQNLQPQYSGELKLTNFSAPVEVLYDNWGVPHIYAKSEEDAFRAMGYVHAQDRLFQMEMLRRVAAGRLSEIFGADLLETDRFFRTLGIDRHARASVEEQWKDGNYQPWQKLSLAYLDGINQYTNKDQLPPEFALLGLHPLNFTIEDLYLGMGFTAFGFAQGFKEDPLVESIYQKLGKDYLADLALNWPEGFEQILPYRGDTIRDMSGISAHVGQLMDHLPVAPWMGSNGWVIAPGKTANGKVLFANDTHMGYAQPSVWYEAHLEAPGLSYYGNFVAGSPFPYLGHNHFAATGLTMLQNDDVDFFVEKPTEENADFYWFGEEKLPFSVIQDTIFVKDSPPVPLQIRSSQHGPIITDVMPPVQAVTQAPVAVAWSYLQLPCYNLQATYNLMKVSSIAEGKAAADLINAPGLNLMYGDVEDNIAWFTTAKRWKRANGQNGKFMLDGSNPANNHQGYHPVAENPYAINPPWQYVYSANNAPKPPEGEPTYPGYYVPESRAKRIDKLLAREDHWTVEKLEEMITDVKADDDLALINQLIPLLENTDLPTAAKQARDVLTHWDGRYTEESRGSVVFQQWLYWAHRLAMADEMGLEMFDAYMGTHLQKRSIGTLFPADSAIWWDNQQTEAIETKTMIFRDAIVRAADSMVAQLGVDTTAWQWKRVHILTHKHPFAQMEALAPYVNVGPMPMPGGNETINNSGFTPNAEGKYEIRFGPAMRRLIDFSQVENSQSVLPTGQSGNLLSPHYQDQAELYHKGGFRPQLMDRAAVEAVLSSHLLLKPAE